MNGFGWRRSPQHKKTFMSDVPHASEVLILAGLFSAGAGGLFAAAQKGVGPLMGYATLFDVGNSLVALGMGTQAGLMLVLYTTLVRVIALSLIGLAGGFLQREGRGDSFEQARGLARRRPLAAVGLMVGGATLAGAPLTAGFISRWLLLQALVEVDSRWPVIIALGGLGVATGFVRALRRLLAPAPPAPPPERAWLPNALIAGLSALCLGIGLFPQPVLDTVKTLARAMHIPVL